LQQGMLASPAVVDEFIECPIPILSSEQILCILALISRPFLDILGTLKDFKPLLYVTYLRK
jgi:hypothetical protein